MENSLADKLAQLCLKAKHGKDDIQPLVAAFLDKNPDAARAMTATEPPIYRLSVMYRDTGHCAWWAVLDTAMVALHDDGEVFDMEIRPRKKAAA